MSKNYFVILVNGYRHIITPLKRYGKWNEHTGMTAISIPDANYNNTGMALCGILKPNETLSDFINHIELRKKSKHI